MRCLMYANRSIRLRVAAEDFNDFDDGKGAVIDINAQDPLLNLVESRTSMISGPAVTQEPGQISHSK